MGLISQEFVELPGIDKKGKPGTILRPVVTFSMNYKRGRIFTTNGLLDSGADYNLFPGEYCYGLGVNIKKGIPVEIGGIGSRVPLKGYRTLAIWSSPACRMARRWCAVRATMCSSAAAVPRRRATVRSSTASTWPR